MNRLCSRLFAVLAATAALLSFAGSAHALMPKHQCSYCHSVHGSDTGFVPRSDQVNLEVLCMGCHLTANGATEAVQPHRGDGSTYPDHYSTCTDCHEVHDNMPNWRKNDPNHAAHDTALGRNGDVRPDGWPVGVNTKLIGREDPNGQTPYAVILTKERDLNKDGVPDRNTAPAQTCNDRTLNDCYVTRTRHVIFENRDASASAVSIHGWADGNEDGMQPSDAIAWGETLPSLGDTGANGGAPHDAICHMCHAKTAKNACGYDGSASCVVHNPQRTCTDCHTHGGCFDRGSACTKWAMPNRDLRTNTLAASTYTATTIQTVTLTANVTNVNTGSAVTETNIPVRFNSNLEGYIGVVYIASLAPGASQNAVIQWVPSKAGSHTMTATAQPVLAEVNVANNTATAPQPVVVTVASNHDVAVTSVTATSPVVQGTTTTVSVQVRNFGTFVETFNVTLDSNRTGKGNLPLTLPVNSLAAGGTTTLNFSWNTTGADLGTHTLTATAATVAGETNTANNSSTTNEVVAVHDVAVTSVTAPAQVEQGSSATVDVQISNPGGFTETFNVTLASDVDGTIQTLSSGALAPGGGKTLNFTWTVGGSATLGARTLTATAATVAGETNTANNSASAASEVIAPTTHDVAVTSVTAPASVNRGTAVTVSVNVSNNGGATETFNVTLASNRDGTIQTLSSGPLAAGNSRTLDFTWTTTPATSLGAHTLTATAATVPGETNTANNSASTTTTVTSHDVAVVSVSGPASIQRGTTGSISVEVRNNGSFTETFTVTLSSNQAQDGNLPQNQNVTNLAAGATTILTFNWGTTGATIGAHTLTATASTVSGELNLANNSATTSVTITGVHDVAVASVSANPTTLKRGGEIVVTVNVSNPGDYTESFNVSLDSNQISKGNLPLSQSVTNLAPGATTPLIFTWATNTQTTATTHTLTATAATVSGETNTANNTGTTNVTITVK